MLCAFQRSKWLAKCLSPSSFFLASLCPHLSQKKNPLWLILASWSWTRFSESRFSLLTDSGDRKENCPTRFLCIDIRDFALSSCILFCPIWLSSLRGLLFSKEEEEGEWILGRGKVEGSWHKRRVGKLVWKYCGGWRIYFQ